MQGFLVVNTFALAVLAAHFGLLAWRPDAWEGAAARLCHGLCAAGCAVLALGGALAAMGAAAL